MSQQLRVSVFGSWNLALGSFAAAYIRVGAAGALQNMKTGVYFIEIEGDPLEANGEA